MSYLGPLRLHFAGQFQADPSTVNNAVAHFDTRHFKPEFQQLDPATSWRPNGTGAFRLLGCKVTAVSYKDGSVSHHDPVVGTFVADCATRVSAKIVDIDPQQQLASQIWGLILRLTDGANDLFDGAFAVASFSDIWMGRAQGRGAQGDVALSTFYQSVIGPVSWGETRGSKFLTQLRRAAQKEMLSIKFNLDGYNMNPTAPTYTLGRIVGTIGPWSSDEPKHFVLGRQLLPRLTGHNPDGALNFMQAAVDRDNKRVIADFGNALPTSRPGGPLFDCGEVELGYIEHSGKFHSLGHVDYEKKDCYETTAAIQPFPHDRKLSRAEWNALKSHRMAVAKNGEVILQENYDGLHVRADQSVFRMEPGDQATTDIWATQYGEPLAKAKIVLFHDTSGFQPSGEGVLPMHHPPQFGIPHKALTFPKTLVTGRDGRAVLKLRAANPGNPRGYVDGQIFGVRYMIRDIAEEVRKNPAFGWNPADFLSVRVFDEFRVDREPTWYDLEPIFKLYGNLFPVMRQIVDLHSYDSVVRSARILTFAFSLPADDPNYMPVTRDLSKGKQQAILKWLKNPIRGTKPAETRTRMEPVSFVSDRPAASITAGAKTIALDTRGTLHIPDDL